MGSRVCGAAVSNGRCRGPRVGGVVRAAASDPRGGRWGPQGPPGMEEGGENVGMQNSCGKLRGRNPMFHPIFFHSSFNEMTFKQSQRNVATQTLLPVVDTQAVVRRDCAGALSPSQRVTDGSDKKTEPPGFPHKIQSMIRRKKLTRKKQEPKFIVRFLSWRVVTQKMLVITKCSFFLFAAAALHPRVPARGTQSRRTAFSFSPLCERTGE